MKCVLLLMASLAMAQTPPPGEAPPPPPAKAPSAADLMRSAIDKQRMAVATQQASSRKQAEAAGALLLPWPSTYKPPGPGADCDPLASDVIDPIMEQAAKKNELSLKLLRAVIEQESGFKACAVSVKGALGLMQLMPDTADGFNVNDPFDPKENVAAGAKFLKQLLDRYNGNTKLALAAYNAGTTAVDTNNGVPDIAETRDYVNAILKKIQ